VERPAGVCRSDPPNRFDNRLPSGSRAAKPATVGTRALCLWMESVWLLLGGGFSIQPADPILVFLERRRFVAKPPIMRVGFCLDFLGFSRPNRDFSMAYTDKREKDFASRFHRHERAIETARLV
jgi:hypothetical protein